jgi:hypothetical protein
MRGGAVMTFRLWILFLSMVLFPILFILLFQVFVRHQMIELKASQNPVEEAQPSPGPSGMGM